MLISFAIHKSYGRTSYQRNNCIIISYRYSHGRCNFEEQRNEKNGKDLFTPVNRNGRRYNVDVLNNAISEWARNNGVFIEGEKDVNYFCQREKNASKYDKHEEYGKLTHCVIDPQCVFIDYTNLLGR